MKKKLIIISLLIGLSIVTMLWSKSTEEAANVKKNINEDPLIYAFKNSEANFDELQIKGWVQVNNSFVTLENLTKIANTIEGQTDISFNNLEKTIEDTAYFRGITIEGYWEKYFVEIYIQSVRSYEAKDENDAETYVYLVISNDTMDENYNNLYKQLKQGLEVLAPNSQLSAILIGSLDKELNKAQREEKITNLFNILEAKKVDGISYDNLTSLSGLSPYFDNKVSTSTGDSNINIALRHNFLEKTTFIYVATPIILMDY